MASVRAQPWTALQADNLTSLSELTEMSLLRAIEERYRAALIYTAVGDILVAVNPFQTLPLYDATWSKAYATNDVSGLAPHIFRVASAAYNSMVQGKKNQVCVISGESGAGKTESAKFIMRQVMDMCCSAGLGLKLQQKIIQLNPLLEAFGNARTELNDNSSRFGKFIQLLFEPNGRIVGAGLEQYLLEKSRVCVQAEKERNFHIFYYLYAGLPEEKKTQLYLKSPEKHRYLQSYCQLSNDCSSEDNREAFTAVLESMENIGFTGSEVEQIITLLAAILHIGDIEFVCSEEAGGDSATIKNPELVETISQLLDLKSPSELSFALTTLRTVTRGEPVDKLYNCSKAAVVRDAAAKALYARMFQWIICRINTHLRPKDNSRSRTSVEEDHLNIGILDIFGFENFERNSFEQFCINLANEQLQQYFNHQIFAMEKMECAKEGVDDLDITYTDNTPVIELFLSRPIGLLCLLDEQCKGLNGSEEGFVQRCRESFTKHAGFVPHRGNALEFAISHYAGEVTYEIDGFLDKNKDSLPEPVVDALKYTSLRLLGALFGGGGGMRNDTLRKSLLRKSQRTVMRAMSQRRRKMSSSPKKRQKHNSKKLLTVSAHFRESLNLLMERLFAASPHFVRCIKPNLQKKADLFESEFVLRQLRYTGMLEAVRVRREGYSYRPFFSDFVTGYRSIAYCFIDEDVKLTEGTCQVILEKAELTGWRLARSRVFLRYYHEQKLQLLLKDMEDAALLIQKIYRGHRARKMFVPLRERRRLQGAQVASLLTRIASNGQIHQPLLKALDRIDILEAPKRFKNRQKENQPTPAEVGPSAADYDGLSTTQRKAKKAQKFGVKVGALVGAPDVLQVALRRQNSPGSSSNPPPSPSSDSKTSPTLTTPPSPSSVSPPMPQPRSSSRPPSVYEVSCSTCDEEMRPAPPKYPPPRSKRAVPTPPSSDNNSSPSPSPSSSPGQAKKRPPPRVNTKPPTSPRRNRRPVNPPSPSSPSTSSSVPPTNTPVVVQNLSPSPYQTTPPSPLVPIVTRRDQAPIPKPRRNIRHRSAGSAVMENGFPEPKSPDIQQHRRLSESLVSSTSSEVASFSLDTVAPLDTKKVINALKSLPTGKDDIRRIDDAGSLEARQPHSSNLNFSNRTRALQVYPASQTQNEGHNKETKKLKSVKIPTKTNEVHMSTIERRALRVNSSGCESTLDFTSRGGSNNLHGNSKTSSAAEHIRMISSSVPDLIEEPPTPPSAPHNTTGGGVLGNRTKALAMSSDTIFTEETPGDYHSVAVGNRGSGRIIPSRSISQVSDVSAVSGGSGIDTPPPQADKRKPRQWFGLKRISRKKSNSSDTSERSSSSSAAAIMPVSPGGRRESGTDILGFYPNLPYDNAVEMISGYPRGTYILLREELQEYSGESGVYKLGVSSGREIKMFPILATCGQYQLVTGAPQIHPPHSSLNSLVDHYKVSELDEGLVLTQPRLVAGITVTGVKVAPRQPQMAKKRGCRKKH